MIFNKNLFKILLGKVVLCLVDHLMDINKLINIS